MEASKDLADYALGVSTAERASYAEARLVGFQGSQFVLKNGNPEIGGYERSMGLGIRLLVGGGMGFASLNELSKKNIELAVKEAVKIAKRGSEVRSKPIEFSEESSVEAKFKVAAKDVPSDVDVETKMEKIFEIDRAVPQGIPFRLMFLEDSQEEQYLVTSEGTKIESLIPRISFFALLTAVNPTTGAMEQGMEQKGASGGYELLDEWDLPSYLEKEAGTIVKVAAEAKKPPTGQEIDWVVGSQVVGIICHENCGHPSEADRILGREGAQAGESFLNPDKLGERIGSDQVTIIDDPTLEGSYGFYLYDSEGIKAQPRYLMKEGFFNEMLHNRESAHTLETKSNGAARAIGYNREPIIRMANTYMAAGDFTEEELIEDVKLGILMKNFTEWNIDDRRFQSKYVGREAYLIENGEVKHLVRRPVLETTTPGLFSSVDGCAKTMEFDAATCGKGDPMQGAPVWHGGTTALRIRNIKIA